MSNSVKNRKKAVEFEQAKQFDKAIASYMRAIEDSEAEAGEVDVALFNKVGDLTLRQGRVADAVTYYERAVEHYVTAALYNNAIALCNKILRSSPGRSAVYFTLGRICARKGLRGDATRNFLEYASRMQQEGRVDEGMRALAEVADLMPELTEVRRLVEEHAARAGIVLPQRKSATPSSVSAQGESAKPAAIVNPKDLVFLDIDYGTPIASRGVTPPIATAVTHASIPPSMQQPARQNAPAAPDKSANKNADNKSTDSSRSARLEDLFIFDPTSADAAAAFDDDVESVVDGASLIMPQMPGAGDTLDSLAGLEPTALEDTVGADEPAQTVAGDGAAAGSMRETPNVTIAFDPAEEQGFESVLGESLVDVARRGEIKVVEPTPGLVSAMEFVVPVDLGESVELVDESAHDEPTVDVVDDTADGVLDAAIVAPAVDDVELASTQLVDAATETVANTPIETEIATEIAPEIDATPESPIQIAVGGDIVTTVVADEVIWLEPTAPSTSDQYDAIEPVADVVSTPVIEFLDIDYDASTPATPADSAAVDTEIVAIEVVAVDTAADSSSDIVADVSADANVVAETQPDVTRTELESVEVAAELPDVTDDANGADDIATLAVETIEAIVAADDSTSADDATSIASESENVVDAVAAEHVPAHTLSLENASNDEPAAPAIDVADAPAIVEVHASEIVELSVASPHTTGEEMPWLASDDLSDQQGSVPDVTQIEGITFEDEEFAASLPFVDAVVVDAAVPTDGLIIDEVATPSVEASADSLDGFVSEAVEDESSELAFVSRLTPTLVSVEAPVQVTVSELPARTQRHDFILPGELPPLVLPDSCVAGAMRAPTRDDATDVEDVISAAHDGDVSRNTESPVDAIDAIVAAHSALANIDAHAADDELDDLEDLFGSTTIPASVAAAEANAVATSRRDELQAAAKAQPRDWALRRRLAEALFEAGEREHALSELQAALAGFEHDGELQTAAEVADELVRVDADRPVYHQKRVQLAVRLKDDNRLREAYLDLADALVRGGDEAPARAVYVRVLEIDPWDDRARTALGDAAPPPPQRPREPQPDDDFVDLAGWLQDDDEPASTRMRMREPVVTGNEQQDFDSLLRHFKEGVSRSLGEEDYESHYDLGVAYKEMGLLDDAVAEFQKALRSRTHRLPAYEALGQCFLEQESYQVAATVLSRALHEPGLGDEQRVGVLYLLGYACEALHRFGEARSYFERVYATDIHFRDVATRLATLDHIAR